MKLQGKNIVEKMDAAEYTAISLFFDKDMRNILLSKREVNNKVELHNQVYGNFLRILNTTSSISRITLYRKDGFSVSAGLENNLWDSYVRLASIDVQLRTSEHRSMYSYVRLSIDRCTATYV